VLPAVRFRLTLAEFAALAEVPPEHEWLANLTNEKTKRAYKADVAEFIAFTGLKESVDLRSVARAHVILWRKDMEDRKLAKASIRRKLSAVSSLFDYLCERNAIGGNPVDGVKRPLSNGNEGSTPALGDEACFHTATTCRTRWRYRQVNLTRRLTVLGMLRRSESLIRRSASTEAGGACHRRRCNRFLLPLRIPEYGCLAGPPQ
jgi:hypothetical protein